MKQFKEPMYCRDCFYADKSEKIWLCQRDMNRNEKTTGVNFVTGETIPKKIVLCEIERKSGECGEAGDRFLDKSRWQIKPHSKEDKLMAEIVGEMEKENFRVIRKSLLQSLIYGFHLQFMDIPMFGRKRKKALIKLYYRAWMEGEIHLLKRKEWTSGTEPNDREVRDLA
jgi:hypothetical protein